MEYLPYGDLLGFLRRSRGKEDKFTSGERRPNSSLKADELLRFAWMIADGMAFLSRNKVMTKLLLK